MAATWDRVVPCGLGYNWHILLSPSLTKSNKAVRNQAQTDRSQRHTATTTSPRCQGSMGVGVSDPCPAQAPNVFVLIGAGGRCPPYHHLHFGREIIKGGWEGLEQPSPLTESAHLSRRFC